jgi:hypothetical protein
MRVPGGAICIVNMHTDATEKWNGKPREERKGERGEKIILLEECLVAAAYLIIIYFLSLFL